VGSWNIGIFGDHTSTKFLNLHSKCFKEDPVPGSYRRIFVSDTHRRYTVWHKKCAEGRLPSFNYHLLIWFDALHLVDIGLRVLKHSEFYFMPVRDVCTVFTKC
jgi:hypothetical protein